MSACSKIDNLSKKINNEIDQLPGFDKARKIRARDCIYKNVIAASESKSSKKATNIFCTKTKTKEVTSEAFLKACKKIKPEFIKRLSNTIVAESYQQMPAIENFKGLDAYRKKCAILKQKYKIRESKKPRVLGFDGSIARICKDILPDAETMAMEKQLDAKYRKVKQKRTKRKTVKIIKAQDVDNFPLVESENYRHGLIMTCYDLVRNLAIHMDLSYSLNERNVFLRMLPLCRPGDLCIFDRGFYSLELAKAVEQAGCYCLFRLSGTPAISKIEGDDIDLTDPEFQSLKVARKLQYHPNKQLVITPNKDKKSKKLIKIRDLKKVTDDYVFFTNAPREILPIDQLPDLYHARWRVEEFYKLLKQTTGGKFYNNKSFRTLQQKIYFQQLSLLMNQFIINVTEKQNEETRERKIREHKRVYTKDYYPISPVLAMEHMTDLNFCILYAKPDYLTDMEFLIYRISTACQKIVRNFRGYPRVTLINHSRHYGSAKH